MVQYVLCNYKHEKAANPFCSVENNMQIIQALTNTFNTGNGGKSSRVNGVLQDSNYHHYDFH